MRKTTVNILATATLALTFGACASNSLTINHQDELKEANKCQVVARADKKACYTKIADTNTYAMIRLAANATQTKDYAKAYDYFQKAQKLGNYHANLGTAFMYYKGTGVKKDLKKSAMVLEEAADKSPNAAFQLSRFYLEGTGVEKDVSKGMNLLESAAKSGLYSAQKKLYKIYNFGRYGIKADATKADEWKKLYSTGKRNFFLEAYQY